MHHGTVMITSATYDEASACNAPSLPVGESFSQLAVGSKHNVVLRSDGKPTIALSVDDHTLAGEVLRRKNFHLLGEADLP